MSTTQGIRLFKPSLGDEELELIKQAFDRAWLGRGPLVQQFEEEWSRYIGLPHSIGLNSCTAALHLSLLAHGFPEGRKVLVPAITFVASAHAVLYNRLEPVFVDVDEHSLTMDLADLERKITDDCVAVIPVHVGGQPVPMDDLLPIAKRHGLLVVEDCANSAGGEYKGKKLGAWGDIGCFSLEEKKNLTSGDGGFICVDDADLDARLRQYRWLGIDRDTWRRAQLGQEDEGREEAMHWYYEVSVLGYKYNMNDLAAAVGLAQFHKLDAMNLRRAELIRRYLDGIADLDSVRPLYPYELEGSAYWIFGIRVDARDRDALILHLKRRGIATGVHFMPIPLHPLYRDYDRGIETAKRVWSTFITLPLHADLTDEEVDYVVEAIHDFAKR